MTPHSTVAATNLVDAATALAPRAGRARHRCPVHGTAPRANSGYWVPKLDRNVARDRRVDGALRAAGWTPVRVWEHDVPAEAVEQVAQVLLSS